MFLLSFLALSACASDQNDAANASSTNTNAPASVWQDSLTLQARVGVLDSAPEYELGRVRQVAIGRDNAFIIADDGALSLRVYDSVGKFMRVIGRSGDGPGEYRSMGGVRTLPDGRIVLWDNRRRVLTTYSDTGAVLSTSMVPSGLFSADLLHVQHDGTAWVRTWLVSLTPPNPLQPRTMENGWVRVASDGAIIDTVVAPHTSTDEPSFELWGPSGYTKPFNREVVSTVTVLGEVLSGDNSAYAFDRHIPGGARKRVEHAYTQIALGDGEREQWEGWAGYFEEANRNRPKEENVISLSRPDIKYSIPRTKPAFRSLMSDSEGRVWVQRYVKADSTDAPKRPAGDKRPRNTWREPSLFDVFSADGTFLGSVTLPFNTRFADARGRQLWVIGTGEDGEEFVARFRIGSASQ